MKDYNTNLLKINLIKKTVYRKNDDTNTLQVSDDLVNSAIEKLYELKFKLKQSQVKNETKVNFQKQLNKSVSATIISDKIKFTNNVQKIVSNEKLNNIQNTRNDDYSIKEESKYIFSKVNKRNQILTSEYKKGSFYHHLMNKLNLDEKQIFSERHKFSEIKSLEKIILKQSNDKNDLIKTNNTCMSNEFYSKAIAKNNSYGTAFFLMNSFKDNN